MACVVPILSNLGDYLMFLKFSLSFKTLVFFKRKIYVHDNEYHDDHYIPRDIQRIILKYLTVHDRIRLGATNKHWTDGLMQKDDTIIPNPTHQLPWLTLPTTTNFMSFFDIYEGKLHKIYLPKQLHGGTCCASSRGWLVIAKLGFQIYPLQKVLNLYLFNPITHDVHKLPCPLSIIDDHGSFVETDIHKWISNIELSSSIIDSQCIVAGIFSEPKDILGFCRPGDKKWITYEYKVSDSFFNFQSLLYWNGKFNTVAISSGVDAICLLEISLGDGGVDSRVITTLFFSSFVSSSSHEPHVYVVYYMSDYNHMIGLYPSRFYLVESVEGNMLMISQTMDTLIYPDVEIVQNREEDDIGPVLEYPTTNKFEVFKVDVKNNCLQKLENIENQVIFVGKETSKCVCSVKDDDNVDGKGIESNCIYFLDNYNNYLGFSAYVFRSFMSRDQGVFNLANGRIRRFIPGLSTCCDRNIMCWLTPTIT